MMRAKNRQGWLAFFPLFNKREVKSYGGRSVHTTHTHTNTVLSLGKCVFLYVDVGVYVHAGWTHPSKKQ